MKILVFKLNLDGPSSRQMRNGNPQQPYGSQISTCLDFSNQIPQQRFPLEQSSASRQHPQAINNTYSSNSSITANNCERNEYLNI